MSCHHHHANELENTFIRYILDGGIVDIRDISVIFALFVYGVVASFTHCVGMCGPIAFGQMNMRLMHLNDTKLTNWHKIQSVLSIPYYVGKALTYGVLSIITQLLATSLSKYHVFQYVAGIVLLLSALMCLKIAFKPFIANISILQKMIKTPKALKFFEKYAVEFINKIHLKPFGLQGLLMGMSLGLIPCGMVVSAILLINIYADNIITAFIAAFCFGLGTFPALFIVSFFGQNLMLRSKKYLSYIYSAFMLINFAVLLRFAIKLI